MDLVKALRAVRMTAPFVLILVLALVGARLGFESTLLGIAATALVLAIGLLWRSLAKLSADDSMSLDEALSLSAPSAEEEQKQAVLRTLKDLEYERSVGKISERDYREVADRYRAEAKRLMQAVDADLEQRRRRVEEEFVARVKRREKRLNAAATESPETTPGDEPPDSADGERDSAPELPACASCGQTNDADAAFCKKCGAGLEQAAESAEGTEPNK
jgi:hypothetical protein